MARTPVNHEEKKALIIQAALKTFTKHGYEGTTNKLIAEEAGKLMGQDGKPISPALIYHYFPQGKSQLFTSCLAQFPPLQRFKDTIMSNQNQPPEVFLPVVARTYNEILRTDDVLPIIRIMVGEGGRQPELVGHLLNMIGPNLLQPLVGYFQKQIQDGHNPDLKLDQIGLQLLGPILVRRVFLATFPPAMMPFVPSTDEEFLESVVRTVLHGLLNRSKI